MEDKQAVEHSLETLQMMNKLLARHERENKRLWGVIMALIMCIVIIVGCMVWTVKNAQNIADEAMWKALNAATEVTTTTTQTAEGENAEINNVEDNIYNDNAIHNEDNAE